MSEAQAVEINGGRVVYELLGPESGTPIVLTPGGRFGKDVPGLRPLAERLADEDELRPGCSIKEAEDVIAALTSFAVFDRLHRDGRRSAAAVTEILGRLAGGILAYHP